MDAYSLGQSLREAREAKELTLASAEATLKIRRHILESFEQGDFSIPDASPVQIRGFIRNYARYLGLDEERTLQHYDSALELSQRRSRRGVNRDATRDRQPIEPITNGATAPSAKRASGEFAQVNTGTRTVSGVITEQRRRVSTIIRIRNALLVLMLGIGAVALILYIAPQLLEPQPDNPQIGNVNVTQGAEVPTLTYTPFAQPFTATPFRQPTQPPQAEQVYNGEPILVTLEIVQRCWLSFTVDGTEVWSGLVRPDEQFRIEYRADTEIMVSASNAAALVLTYNGQPQASYGTRGQSVQIRFHPNNDIQVVTGVGQEPTIEFTPTPTFTTAVENLDTPSPAVETLPMQTDEIVTEPTIEASETGASLPPISPSSPTAAESATETLAPSSTPTTLVAPTSTSTIAITPTFTPTPTQPADLPPRITPTPATPVKP